MSIFSKTKRMERKKRNSFGGSRVGTFFLFVILISLGVFMIFPIYLSVIQSIKAPQELFEFPPKLYAISPTDQNYVDMFRLVGSQWVPFSRYAFNSAVIAVSVTFLQLVFASSAAYALAKVKFPGVNFLNKLITLALLFTSQVLFIMQYLVLATIGLIDTMFAVILPAIATAMGLFLMKQFMGQIHDSMIEAAKLDGASHIRICWQIVMPNVKPAWLTLMIFAFQGAWQINGYAFIYSEQLKPIPAVLQQIATEVIRRAGVSAATVVIMMVPPIVLFLIAQSNIIETMAQSGIKD